MDSLVCMIHDRTSEEEWILYSNRG
jgi:hypothetical protein